MILLFQTDAIQGVAFFWFRIVEEEYDKVIEAMNTKNEIILVGTFHFFQDEELIKNKSLEVSELVDYLAEYNPTKIALEWEKTNQQKLDEAYKNLDNPLSIDEKEQVGFRLANKLKHNKVFAVNWEGRLNQEDMPVLNEAIQLHYPEIAKTMTAYLDKAPNISPNKRLITSFKELNQKEMISELETLYISFSVVEKDGESIGTQFLSKWLERELMIFKNVLQITENQKEQILLFIGSDHLWMLEKLFNGMGWNVINPFQN